MPAISCQLSGKTRDADVWAERPLRTPSFAAVFVKLPSRYDEGPRGYPGYRAAFMASADNFMPILAALPQLATAKADPPRE
jgi:hypothetical protein